MTRFSFKDQAITYLPKVAGRSGEVIWGVGYVPAQSIGLKLALEGLTDVKGRILEVGCGAGRYIRTIKRLRPDLTADGCDSSAQAIDRAKEYGDDVDFAVNDGENLLYGSAAFDAVIFFDLLEHLSDPQRAISRHASCAEAWRHPPLSSPMRGPTCHIALGNVETRSTLRPEGTPRRTCSEVHSFRRSATAPGRGSPHQLYQI